MLFNRILLIGALAAIGSCSTENVEIERDSSFATAQNPAITAIPAPRMVAIHAGYCSVCHEMNSLVERIADECGKKGLRVDLFDVADENDEYLLDEYRVVALPTYLFIDKQGREAARLVGAQTDSALKQALAALTGSDCPGLKLVKADGENVKEGV